MVDRKERTKMDMIGGYIDGHVSGQVSLHIKLHQNYQIHSFLGGSVGTHNSSRVDR